MNWPGSQGDPVWCSTIESHGSVNPFNAQRADDKSDNDLELGVGGFEGVRRKRWTTISVRNTMDE